MADDALAKAGWVLRNEIIAAVCGDACELTRQTCDGCPVRLLEKAVPHVARAVLEAAGIDALQRLADAVASIIPDSASASAFLRSFAREKEKKQGYVSGEVTWLNRVAIALENAERIKVALQRAGKE